MTNYELYKDYISHHGVKGQKWGVRRKPASVSRASGSKKPVAPDSKDTESSKASRGREKSWTKAYRKRGQMSNEELKSQVDRLRLETEFKRLSSEAAKSDKPKSFMQQFMSNTLKEVQQQVPKAIIAAAVSGALSSKSDSGSSGKKAKKNG